MNARRHEIARVAGVVVAGRGRGASGVLATSAMAELDVLRSAARRLSRGTVRGEKAALRLRFQRERSPQRVGSVTIGRAAFWRPPARRSRSPASASRTFVVTRLLPADHTVRLKADAVSQWIRENPRLFEKRLKQVAFTLLVLIFLAITLIYS